MNERDNANAQTDMRELVDTFLRRAFPDDEGNEFPEWVYDLAMEAYERGREESEE